MFEDILPVNADSGGAVVLDVIRGAGVILWPFHKGLGYVKLAESLCEGFSGAICMGTVSVIDKLNL